MGRRRTRDPKKAMTLTEIFLKYPWKNKEDLLRNDGHYYFPNDQVIDNHIFSLTYKEYLDIINILISKIVERILEGNIVKLPIGLGTMSLVKYRNGTLPIDWNTTNKLYGDHNKVSDDKKRVYFRNDHTDGHKVLMKWNTSRNNLKNKTLINFELNRRVKRKLAEILYNDTSHIYNIDSV